jgi:hypothetical protein
VNWEGLGERVPETLVSPNGAYVYVVTGAPEESMRATVLPSVSARYASVPESSVRARASSIARVRR